MELSGITHFVSTRAAAEEHNDAFPLSGHGSLPGASGDPSVTIDLQAVFNRCYDAGPYRREIRYWQTALVPPLRPEQEEWAARLRNATE